jgi:hypothetical protein
MEFTASLDTAAKVITTAVCILFAGIFVWNIVALKQAKGDKVNLIIRIAIFAVLLFSIGASYYYSTKGYEIRGKALIIKTHNKDITLKWVQITDVREVSDAEMSGLSRTFGVGGVFGYSGHYHNPSIGDMTFYATQQKNRVLIHTDKNEAIIMTPDDPAKFVYEISAIITPNN